MYTSLALGPPIEIAVINALYKVIVDDVIDRVNVDTFYSAMEAIMKKTWQDIRRYNSISKIFGPPTVSNRTLSIEASSRSSVYT